MKRSASCRAVVAAATAIVTLSGGKVALAQFTSNNVSQYDWLDLSELSAGSGNDCWGYVSPTGREYALMGLSSKLTVVEITIPGSPVIVGSVSHTTSGWGDIKTYDHYCYVVNEDGGGMDVVDLGNVDGGVVSLVQRVTTGGLATSHNVALNPDSGFLYLVGSNLNGGAPVVYDLADPANPVEAGRWTEPSAAYHHDAHIVSYTSGPYAGREILFGFSEGRGVDILDVTDKEDIFLISRTPYPGVQYCHQGWTSADLKYLFIDDELDEGATVPTTRTIIFDITDLSNPMLAAEFTNGFPGRDHNLYIRGCTMYQANYSSGLRVYNISNPLAPVEVGFYDTFPENDNLNFSGAWSCYPFFPSGTVIVSDIDRGLFILNPAAAEAASAAIPGAVLFSYPVGRPDQLDPSGGTSMFVNVAGTCGSSPMPGTGVLHYNDGGGFQTVAMNEFSPGMYEAIFPATDCPAEVEFYVSAQSTGGGTYTNPPGAPGATYSALSVSGYTNQFADNFQTDTGWTSGGLASSGHWQRGEPVDDPFWDYDPPTDSDGSGQCFLTENDFGNTDVDSGSVELISPNLDMSGSGPFQISYDYYLYLTVGGGDDRLLVEISSNGTGGPWTTVATHDTSGGLAWRSHAISQQVLTLSGVSLTANMRVRFTANDGGDQSIVEAGVDAFSVDRVECESCSDGILNQGEDLIDCGGPCGPCECLNSGACDDGAFCNGAESCDGFGQCQPGSDPCTGSACRESDDSCVAYGDGDFDADLDRDLQDYAAMQNCFGQDAAGACEPGNLNGGIEIDLDDYAEFQPLVGPPN